MIVSYKLFSINETTYLIGLCKDSKIRLFCLKTNQCIYVEDIVKHLKLDSQIMWEESMLDIVSFDDCSIFSIVITSMNEFKVCNLTIEISDSNIRISEVSKKNIRKNGKLVNLHMSTSKVWLMYKNDQASIEIVTVAINQSNLSLVYLEESHLSSQERAKISRVSTHNDSNFSDDEEQDYEGEELINYDCTKTDIKERYLKLIFEPYKYSKMNILKALGVSDKFLFDLFTPMANGEVIIQF